MLAPLAALHPAQMAQRRHPAEERGGFTLGGRLIPDGAANQLRVLRDDFFEVKKCGSSSGLNFFARAAMAKLLNCFQHSMWVSIRVIVWPEGMALMRAPLRLATAARPPLGREKNDRAALHLPRRDVQAGKMQFKPLSAASGPRARHGRATTPRAPCPPAAIADTRNRRWS